MDTIKKKKRGRPKKTVEQKQHYEKAAQVQKEIVEVFTEVVKYIPEPRLEGFELYRALEQKGFPQGGSGQIMEDPNGTTKAYIPTYGEVIAFFMADPEKMEQMRDAVIRAYIEIA